MPTVPLRVTEGAVSCVYTAAAVPSMGETGVTCRILVRNSVGNIRLEERAGNTRITLQRLLRKQMLREGGGWDRIQ